MQAHAVLPDSQKLSQRASRAGDAVAHSLLSDDERTVIRQTDGLTRRDRARVAGHETDPLTRGVNKARDV